MTSIGWKTVGTILQIAGTLTLALNIPESWEAYWTMLVGAAIMLWQYRWDSALWPLWLVFVIINITGIIRWTPR